MKLIASRLLGDYLVTPPDSGRVKIPFHRYQELASIGNGVSV